MCLSQTVTDGGTQHPLLQVLVSHAKTEAATTVKFSNQIFKPKEQVKINLGSIKNPLN